ncbi:AMP-binding protein [Microbacterium sp. ARD31]|nr:AMP-binding protein [Microbacterium sp. ARD31]
MPRPTTDGFVPWPIADADRFRASGYWEDRSLFAHFADAAAGRPDDIAVVDAEVRLSYGELLARVEAAAARLLALGLRMDDRVLIQLPNSWEFIAFTLACFRAGVVPVMALPAHREHELEYLAELSESVAFVVPATHRDFDHESLAATIADQVASLQHVIVLGEPARADSVRLDDLLARTETGAVVAPPQPAGDAIACFLLSGGTTGLPKLIARTHNDYAYNVRVTSEVAGLTADSVYLISLPASHNFPLACPGFLGALFAGGRVVSIASPEPRRAFEAIARERVTVTAAVPAVVQRWIEYQEQEHTDQLTSLRSIQVGGSRIADEVGAKVGEVLGATLQQVFGMAEGLINMTRLDDDVEVIVGTQGRPCSTADEVKIVDESGEELPPGATGVLLTRGPYTPRGYFRAPEHNAKAFTPDGWYISGDIVELRADGNMIVQGRDKDMINRGGEKISGEEIENLVYRHPQVALAAAVAMPDALLGERVCVYVTLRDDATLDLEEVREAMRRAGVAAFKHPERLVVVDDIPLTKVGKIDKKTLRADIAGRIEEEAAREGSSAAG